MAGSTSRVSPTIPRFAIRKIGALGSVLIATMVWEDFIPITCWTAPDIPHAM
jgi:hypothetical protein